MTIRAIPAVRAMGQVKHRVSQVVKKRARRQDLLLLRNIFQTWNGAMMNVLEHKGYSARIELDPEDECFVGRLAGIDDGIGFHGSTIAELITAFHEAVDDYVETCRHLDKQPQRPFSGNDKPRITLSITIDGTAEIWVNPAGRDLLVQHLTTLSSSNDHFHLGEGMDVELSPRPYSETDTLYEWGKVYFRPDDWDRKNFPHVFATSVDKPDH